MLSDFMFYSRLLFRIDILMWFGNNGNDVHNYSIKALTCQHTWLVQLELSSPDGNSWREAHLGNTHPDVDILVWDLMLGFGTLSNLWWEQKNASAW